MHLNTSCEKCPAIKGDTYCDHHKKTIWKHDDMCAEGYLLRIEKGVNMINDTYDDKRIEKIWAQVQELEDIWAKKFKIKDNDRLEIELAKEEAHEEKSDRQDKLDGGDELPF